MKRAVKNLRRLVALSGMLAFMPFALACGYFAMVFEELCDEMENPQEPDGGE